MPEFLFWYTLAVLFLMTLCLVFELLETELAVFSSLLLLIIGGGVSVTEAFAGFSNPGVLTVGFLYVVASSLHATGVIEKFSSNMFGNSGNNIPKKLNRMLFPVAGLSAFLNNTPIIAMLIPAVKAWCRRNNFSSSKFLIPISFAAILGGTCTLIGTSTNLIIHGMLISRGFDGFSFFELALVGVPVTIFGILVISFFLHTFLPDRKEAIVELGEHTREFVVELKVNKNYPYIGSTVEEAGLRHLQGLFIFQIERNGNVLAPVQPTDRIQKGDRLFFNGVPETIVELQKYPGLDIVKDLHFDLKNYDSDEKKTFEVVISQSSPLVGKTVRESNFRAHYNAIILAIHRNGIRVDRKIGDIKLEVGDTLLILSDKDFHNRWYHSRDFYLISMSNQAPSKPKFQSMLTVFVALGMVAAATLGIVPIVIATGAAAVVLILAKCINIQEAFNKVEWKILLTIASAFGIATAIENAGVAQLFASYIFDFSAAFGMLGLIAAVYIMTSIYTEIITNNAAAALLFPIGFAVALQSGLDVMPLSYAVVFGASAGFATPIGYQTNLMVKGPGRYTFTDYLKIGIPLKVLIGVPTVLLIYFIFN